MARSMPEWEVLVSGGSLFFSSPSEGLKVGTKEGLLLPSHIAADMTGKTQ